MPLERPNPSYNEGTNIGSSPPKDQEIFAHQAKIKKYLLTRQIRRLEKLGLRSRGLFCLERMRMQMIFPELENSWGKTIVILNLGSNRH